MIRFYTAIVEKRIITSTLKGMSYVRSGGWPLSDNLCPDNSLSESNRSRLKFTNTRLFSSLFISLFLFGCSQGSDLEQPVPDYTYAKPAQINDGWQTASAYDLGIDPILLEDLTNNVLQEINDFRYIDSVLVTKNSQLIFHEEFKPGLDFTDDWAENQNIELHVLNSVTKSFLSTLVGIAIDQGAIANVQVPVHDYFQHKQPIANWSNEKSEITLENWLTMRHGYQWDEWDVSYFDPGNQNAQMNDENDPIQYLLDTPMTESPGSQFAYSTGVSFGIGRLMQIATQQNLSDFMEQYLFAPLNITQYTYWSLDDQIHTGSALYLSTRDMAKLGQLYLDDGLWNGMPVVSYEWIQAATTRRHDAGEWGYGYQWWMGSYYSNGNSYETYYADGLGGQYIFVFPELDAVVAFTGSAYSDDEKAQRSIRRILEQFILPTLM